MATNFKISVTVFLLLILPTALFAQKDVTQFLGIPVDGSKLEMIEKLKSKGFTISSSNKDVLVGEFNGASVNIHIATNNNKVCRIMVADVNDISEGDIKIRFNKLCQQFHNNGRYMSASLSYPNNTISNSEDISYEISVHNKRYEASYYQLPAIVDSVANVKELQSFLLSKYTKEQLSNPTEELKKNMLTTASTYLLEKYSKKSVWFMVNVRYGKYYMTMFYDNEYNRANGENL
ncbi:MAG: hypothetical protein WCJ03_09005 [Bacteroidales bacterium]